MHLIVVGNRPQLTKLAPLVRSLRNMSVPFELCYTDQHFTNDLKISVMRDLNIEFDHVLTRIEGTVYESDITRVIDSLSRLVKDKTYQSIIGLGDTNSTVAASLVSHFNNIPFVHIEGGERLYNRNNVPEEFNRILCDHSATLIVCSSRKSYQNLLNEGFDKSRLVFCGDLMYDNFLALLGSISTNSSINEQQHERYAVCTIHRAENTDDPFRFRSLIEQLKRAPILIKLYAHPRIHNALDELDVVEGEIQGSLLRFPAIPPTQMIKEITKCEYVVTDSGGLSREALFCKKHCYTMLPSTWWPEAIELGLGTVIDTDLSVLPSKQDTSHINSNDIIWNFGDGRASDKIARILAGKTLTVSEVKWIRGCDYRSLPRPISRTNFTFDYYVKYVRKKVAEGYALTRARDIIAKPFGKSLFLRHDVDFCVGTAKMFADMEVQNKIYSTYYFMLDSQHYNLFTKENKILLQDIYKMGHEVGLHFDASFLNNDCEVNREITSQAKILSDIIGNEIVSFSFHRPNERILKNLFINETDLLNCYDKITFGDYDYISDSAGVWKHSTPDERDEIRSFPNIQLLTHPIWWCNHPRTPFYQLTDLLETKRAALSQSFKDNCKSFKA